MKKILLLLLSLSILALGSNQMKNFRSVPADKVQLLQKGKGKNFCPVCGMTLPVFYKTNHAAKHNGKDHQYCSIHCLAEDAEVNGKKLDSFKAVDNVTLKFADSKSLYFVVGSNKPGTMSVVSKYGFSKKEAAQKFAQEFGGEIMSFKEVYALTKERLDKDIQATKKRQAKAAKKGKIIYSKMCKQTTQRFKNPSDAKTFLMSEKLCGKLKGKPLQQVALFLAGKGDYKAPQMKCGAGKCGGGKCNPGK
jgi:YHS domain-containing protein